MPSRTKIAELEGLIVHELKKILVINDDFCQDTLNNLTILTSICGLINKLWNGTIFFLEDEAFRENYNQSDFQKILDILSEFKTFDYVSQISKYKNGLKYLIYYPDAFKPKYHWGYKTINGRRRFIKIRPTVDNKENKLRERLRNYDYDDPLNFYDFNQIKYFSSPNLVHKLNNSKDRLTYSFFWLIKKNKMVLRTIIANFIVTCSKECWKIYSKFGSRSLKDKKECLFQMVKRIYPDMKHKINIEINYNDDFA